jgi:hypothetical protein
MITIVSGIPRSGTSLMMQMLAAGGMAAMTDGQRASDPNNPRGYYEFELVKSLARNPEVMADAEGKVAKVVSSLLKFLPAGHDYRIIFMRRPLLEVVASQDRMLERLGKAVPAAAKESVIAAFEQHLKQVGRWLSEQKNMPVLYVDYTSVLEDATSATSRICTFLQKDLDTAAMATRVDLSLHREKLTG